MYIHVYPNSYIFTNFLKKNAPHVHNIYMYRYNFCNCLVWTASTEYKMYILYNKEIFQHLELIIFFSVTTFGLYYI